MYSSVFLMTAANSATTSSQSGDKPMVVMLQILTERDASVAILVKQLKCSFVECIGLTEETFEGLEL
jgi:hypothetical protein